jgi:hypothetical protein
VLADPTRILLFAQLGIQVILIVFVVFLLVIEKRRKIRPDVLEELRSVVKQTSELSDSFHGQIQQKIDLVTKVLSDLDTKTRSAEILMRGLEETTLKVKNARQFTPGDVQRLHMGGFDAVEISQITGIPVGEIQLMVKVANQNTV